MQLIKKVKRNGNRSCERRWFTVKDMAEYINQSDVYTGFDNVDIYDALTRLLSKRDARIMALYIFGKCSAEDIAKMERRSIRGVFRIIERGYVVLRSVFRDGAEVALGGAK